MPIRTLAFLCLLVCTACGPTAPSSSESADPAAASSDAAGASTAPAPARANPAYAELSEQVLSGQWFYGVRGRGAAFGEPQTEALFQFDCQDGQISFTYTWDESAPQRDSIEIITATQSFVFPAEGSDEGIPLVFGTLDADDPRLDALAAPQTRFGAAIDGMVGVLPWEERLGEELRACGV